MSFITTSQVWDKLERHASEIKSLRLVELLRDADDKVASLVAVHNNGRNIVIADLSRQHMSSETIHTLYQLAASRNLRKFITEVAWGSSGRGPNDSPSKKSQPPHKPSPSKRVNIDTTVPPSSEPQSTTTTTLGDSSSSMGGGVTSMHMALRVPRGNGPMLTSDNDDALQVIHDEWDRIQKLSESIRTGQRRGVTGSMIRDVVVVGRGVGVEALKFVHHALVRDQDAHTASQNGLTEAPSARIRRNLLAGAPTRLVSAVRRRLHFLSSIDPVAAAVLTDELDPAATLVVSIALEGREETGLATKYLKSWLLYTLGSPSRRPDQSK